MNKLKKSLILVLALAALLALSVLAMGTGVASAGGDTPDSVPTQIPGIPGIVVEEEEKEPAGISCVYIGEDRALKINGEKLTLKMGDVVQFRGEEMGKGIVEVFIGDKAVKLDASLLFALPDDIDAANVGIKTCKSITELRDADGKLLGTAQGKVISLGSCGYKKQGMSMVLFGSKIAYVGSNALK